MSKVRIESFTLSLDGLGAGLEQSLDQPLGRHGTDLHAWAFATRTFRQRVLGLLDGETGIDDDFAARGFDGVGAWILGRNLFGPQRGPWEDFGWQGWWGDNPPYHAPAFVLTHHPRPTLTLSGGTSFHFVTGGIHDALHQARQAAGRRDVRIVGGVSVLRQYLRAGLVDEMHLAVAPVLLGRGEALFSGLDLRQRGYRCTRQVAGARAQHLVFQREGPAMPVPAPQASVAVGTVRIALEAPGQADVLQLIDELDAFQKPLYPAESHHGIDLQALSRPQVLFAVARDAAGAAVACGAIVQDGRVGELKRMYTLPSQRGRGLGQALLGFLESQAQVRGIDQFVLETGPRQPQALALYARCGYQRCGPFGDYTDDPHSVFMRKSLVAAPPTA